ncbi:Class V chitinase [Linum perenne]
MAAAKSFTLLLCFFFFFFFFQLHNSTADQQKWVKAAYWDSASDFPITGVNSALFTHLFCAFAHVNSSTFHISIGPTSLPDFSAFTATVRRQNPDVTILISVRDVNLPLSAVASTASRRSSFIRSSIQTARLHGFQGIDLCWMWPNGTDIGKFETLIDEFRSAIDSEGEKSNNSKLLLTMAAPRSPNLSSATYPVRSMVRNLDWAHLVAYDYHLPTKENFTANHAALFGGNDSTDSGVKEWVRVGFPANKLGLGVPYHGYGWRLVDPRNNSLGAPASGPDTTISGDMGYKLVKATVQEYGYGAGVVYDSRYVVNYFVVGKTWINFDGVEAVRAKVSYAVERGMLGFVAFQLSNDDNWELSRAAQLMDMEESGRSKKRRKQLLVLETLSPALIIVLLFMVVLWYIRRRRASKNQKDKLSLLQFGSSNRPNLRAFSFSEIKSATNDFSGENLLGSGGFGPVYKGVLAGGEVIAVKRLKESSNQGTEEFRNEVSLTARLQHVNLARVLGFCTEKEEKMLVYEFMANGSLHLYLFECRSSEEAKVGLEQESWDH